MAGDIRVGDDFAFLADDIALIVLQLALEHLEAAVLDLVRHFVDLSLVPSTQFSDRGDTPTKPSAMPPK